MLFKTSEREVEEQKRTNIYLHILPLGSVDQQGNNPLYSTLE